MLRTACDGGFDSRFFDMVMKNSHGIIYNFFPGLPLLLHLANQVAIFFWVQVMETEIFQFPLDIVNP